MTRVKICGLMNLEDVDFCIQAGVHVLGFVVEYPTPVPWNLLKAEAKELIFKAPPYVSTCVVTGGTVEKVLEVVNETCPNMVQLHYRESLEEIEEIARKLKLRGVKVIKALRMGRDEKCDFEVTDPALAACELAKTGVSAILVDSYTESLPGGTGVTVDLSVFKRVQEESPVPVILAGGLNPENIIQVIEQARPFAVDVLSGVEEKPGHKDPERVGSFMKSIRA